MNCDAWEILASSHSDPETTQSPPIPEPTGQVDGTISNGEQTPQVTFLMCWFTGQRGCLGDPVHRALEALYRGGMSEGLE
jgi:hypothetical protein